MADNNNASSSNNGWIEVGFWAVLLIILFRSLTGIAVVIEDTLGIDTGGLLFVDRTVPLTEDTPTGSWILTTDDAPVRNAPGGDTVSTVPVQTEGELREGPVLYEGVRWWYVRFPDNTVGWVSEAYIERDLLRDRERLNDASPLGTRIVTTEATDIWSSPDRGFVLAQAPRAARGALVQGPQVYLGVEWWRVRFEEGIEGWMAERYLAVDTPRNIRAVKEDTPLNTKIQNLVRVVVLSNPSGDTLGAQEKNARGSVDGGPAIVGLDRWWHIDYANDPDGWVREADIERHLSLLKTLQAGETIFITTSRIISLILLFGIVYIVIRLRQVNIEARQKFAPLSMTRARAAQVRNPRWEKVVGYAESLNPNDWRLAVLEADILLDEMVSTMGYEGENLGDKLKAIEKSDFLTLDLAWEAHKMRNQIAHQGSDLVLTQREAERIIGLYRQVFQEFHFI